MTRILTVVLLVCAAHGLIAQRDIENKLKLDMWTNAPAEFKTTAVPDKWKNESAVVLALAREYIGDFRGKFYSETLTTHYRIKLLDKAAIEDYSDLSFDDKTIRTNLLGKATAYRIIAIKVIKPNGTEKVVDLSQAVKTDVTSDRELKIPIPNLEAGDIIDYYVAMRDETFSYPSLGDEIIMEGKYPMVYNSFRFTIPDSYQLTSKAYNGAADFTKEVQKNVIVYTVQSKMQEKSPDLLWDYEYRTAPHVRFKMTSEKKKPDPKAAAEEILSNFSPNISNIGFLEDFININFKKEKDPRKISYELYYALRNPIYKKAYFRMDQGDPINAGYAPNMFFLLVDKYLKHRKIDYEIILVSPRWYGPISDVVSFSYCDFVVKVNTNPVIYLSRPTPFTLPNEMAYTLEGVEGVSGKHSTGMKLMPVSTPEQNILTTQLNTSLDPEDNTKLKVTRHVIAKGRTKTSHQYLVFTNYDYLKAYDQPKYMEESSSLIGGLIKEYKKEKTKFEQRQATDYNERDTRIKADIERGMDAKVSDYTLTVKSIGMWDTAPDADYTDQFTLENMTRKAGPNIIVELGKLIEKQTDLTPEQKTRTRDVYMEYPRTYVEEITFTIPEGYRVEGLENLTRSITSDAGGFVSSAVVNGNVLTVKTKKYYTKNFYKTEEWAKITPFLAAAAEFYGGKILLKK